MPNTEPSSFSSNAASLHSAADDDVRFFEGDRMAQEFPEAEREAVQTGGIREQRHYRAPALPGVFSARIRERSAKEPQKQPVTTRRIIERGRETVNVSSDLPPVFMKRALSVDGSRSA